MKKEKTDTTESSFSLYEDSIKKIKNAVEQGLSFDQACSLVDINDPGLRESIINDSLNVLVAEMHFSTGIPLKQLAMKLRLSLSRLMNARERMLKEKEGVTAPEHKASITGHLSIA